ncbi:L-threonylcarbamoyladenylate synthase [Propionibacterium australiense]|uniref:L-threonylcarbamoyladenylate synthase n=1 Tax=Propionibacterium australiense TaxID=119981 RepID=A0A383S4S0_9ACTN|nr:L-threonylcarbamoyladenylate synthase [Propionibacterium australiense]RLP11652.1 threonylcarbamoyl-AMP synthase [Propionibacterium australiense]RLP12165.1 threonylcarbamoyl-AMP synthase [Propionibacterium australiense]SYZ32384.1 DHBP synthase RibB-like alpha/beta domain [Propionibacterium australiense]VEH90321.1 t(6)A37 threonylcarbamoyladenosine biosynthesis protein RimN [Propionibacterium australiense]
MSTVSEAKQIETASAAGDAPAVRFDLRTQRDEAMAAARRAVEAGRTIVLPTDTVYGIGADPFSPQAVQGLLDAKHRGRDMPPPVLIAEPAMLPALAAAIPPGAKRMVARFWPGALTLILRAPTSLRMDLGESGGTIAVRVPDNDDARELLRHTGPLAVSSANVSGQEAATDVDRARAMLGDSVAVYLDGGPTPGSTASTIVDFTKKYAGRILRAGTIGYEELLECSPGLEDAEPPAPDPGAGERPDGQAPGAAGTPDPAGTHDRTTS